MNRIRLPRRSFLRGVLGGAAVSVGLPALEAMYDGNGQALADGSVPPLRFGLWFFGNGIRRAHWTPDAVGAAWTAKAELQPLVDAGVRDYVSPVSGLEIKTATHPHHSGFSGVLTGARYYQVGTTRDTIVSTCAYPTIDQVVAERWAQDPATRAPFRSLELGICRFRGTDEGTTFQHLSHNGPNNVNPSEYDPLTLFNRLFSAPPSAQLVSARRSLLDAVKTDLDSLMRKVGRSDKLRLEQHSASIRSIEERLQAGTALCTTPGRPAQSYPDNNGNEPIEEKNAVMSDILAMALACDLTRVFSVLYSTAGAGTVFWQVGAQNGQHQIAHDEADPGPELQPILHASVVFTMRQLGYLLAKLKSIPEGAGNLLDNCAIYSTTELSEGHTHTNDEFPILFAGRAGGRLRGGYHYRSNRENTSKALLTMLRAVGDPRPSFGVDAGETSEVISELLV